ncbi:lytic transglycosylase domain-containing protein [Nocardiopsis sp. ATB16-24]|uniref:aggregation-promoting factor C-terminal-like domain-containing protein n=1 Tax=Nocardiopsis sp. ATB16-24 TaxID=3019555 RepID=UPI0025575706|nr:lytic transglycosylase domain-containing protein [Nocardiopsis sp. ATB16-24]
MSFHPISLRHAGAVGAATLVAGGTFAVAAFAADGAVAPEQLAAAAVVPDGPVSTDGGGGVDDFFAADAEQSDQERQTRRDDDRERFRAEVDEAVRSASTTGDGIPEPEPEPVVEPAADTSGGGGDAGSSVPSGSPKQIALQMVQDQGWGASQFHDCLEPLWEKESNWNHTAQNPSSGAYGIPQSLPGNKMATHGDDWQTNPATQIAWGIDYIKGRYGDPCGAWAHSQANNWY